MAHSISLNVELRMIEVKLTGLCSMDEFREFVTELRSAISNFPRGLKPPTTLYDFTQATIQTQEVVAAMKALAENPVMVHRRVAMYTEGVLAKRQAERICENRSNMFVFQSRAAALDWLANGSDYSSRIMTPAGETLSSRPDAFYEKRRQPHN